MKKLIFLLTLIVAVATISCHKLNGHNPSQHIDRLKAILLGKDTLNLYVGETRQVPVTVSPSDYDLDSIKWKSSDTTIISISPAGLLSAKKIGSSIITVSNLTHTLSVDCLVSVVAAPADSLKIGLIAFYPFNNSAVDSSGNGYNGINNGASPATDRNGKANAAYHFDGVNNNVRVADVPALRLHNTDYTINAWVNLNQYNLSTASVVLCKRTNTADGYALSITGSSQSRGAGLVSYGPGGPFDNFWGSNILSLGHWYMLTIIYNASNNQVKSYINGNFDNASDTNMSSPNSNVDFYIGSDNPYNGTGYFFSGDMNDVRIYNRKLSPHELQVLYQRPD